MHFKGALELIDHGIAESDVLRGGERGWPNQEGNDVIRIHDKMSRTTLVGLTANPRRQFGSARRLMARMFEKYFIARSR